MKLPSGAELFRICLKIFGFCCWALWGGFTLGLTGMTMYQILSNKAPFFQGIAYAMICGVGIGFILTYVPKRFMMKYECERAAKTILGDFKTAIERSAKIREKIKIEFDLMVKLLMEGDTDQAAVHQKNLQRLQSNYEAVYSEHTSLFDGKNDEPKTTA